MQNAWALRKVFFISDKEKILYPISFDKSTLSPRQVGTPGHTSVHTLEMAKAIYQQACQALNYSERITRETMVLIERSEVLLKKTQR